MSTDQAFLQVIVDDPSDDVTRLVYADWLEEQGKSDQAEFIRLQVAREGSGHSKGETDLPQRERELMDEYRGEWLGPLASLKSHEGLECTFRRGFVDVATIHGRLLAEQGAALRRHCPALRELDVVGVRGHGADVAREVPEGIRVLRLEDWPLPEDAKVLAESSRFSRLELLSFWLGSQNDEEVCRILGPLQAFTALQRIELIQLRGGLDAEESAAELDVRSDQFAAVLDAGRERRVATVIRPCSELLPLAPYVGGNLHGGVVGDGRLAVIHARIAGNVGRCEVVYFDPAGNLLSGEVIPVTGELRQEADYRGYNEQELYGFLQRRIGFRPELIRVHEFSAEQVIPDSWTRVFKFDGNVLYFIECADGEDNLNSGSREEQLESVRFWFRGGNFCINRGGDDAWAGPDGKIHST